MRSIFLSRPSTVTPDQEKFLKRLDRILTERNLTARTVGQTDYPNEAPIGKVRSVMLDCHGAIIVGLKQIHIVSGLMKPGTPKESAYNDVFLPTAWNNLEAGIAFALGRPLLILREPGVEGGVFDVGSTDRFVHQANLTGRTWLRSQQFMQPFNSWHEEVMKFDPSPVR